MNAAIATKLNVLESAIVRVEEWANVLFVVVKGLGARFVSKKVVEIKKMEYAIERKTSSGSWVADTLDSFVVRILARETVMAERQKTSCYLHSFIEGQWLTINAQGEASTIEIRLHSPIQYCDRNAASILQCWADTQLHSDRLSALCRQAAKNVYQ